MKNQKCVQYNDSEISIIKHAFIYVQLLLQLVFRLIIFLLYSMKFDYLIYQSPAENFCVCLPFIIHFVFLIFVQIFFEGFNQVITDDWYFSIGRVLFYDLGDKKLTFGFVNFFLIHFEHLLVYIFLINYKPIDYYEFILFGSKLKFTTGITVLNLCAFSLLPLFCNLLWIFYLCPFSSQTRNDFVKTLKSAKIKVTRKFSGCILRLYILFRFQ